MSDLEKLLKSKVKEINTQEKKLKKVDEWVDGYRGKIIGIGSGDEAYHLVFTKGNVSLRKGEYPSVELTYLGDAKSIGAILRGETTTKTEIRKGNIKTWHNLHEAVPFEEVLRI